MSGQDLNQDLETIGMKTGLIDLVKAEGKEAREWVGDSTNSLWKNGPT